MTVLLPLAGAVGSYRVRSHVDRGRASRSVV
jgi:hypothetical protein